MLINVPMVHTFPVVQFFYFWKKSKNREKSKAIALTFRSFLDTFLFLKKEQKEGKK
jgi:hypothetical protein